MKLRGMYHRQVRNLKEACDDSRHDGRLVGNSPELMPLDNNLFADLQRALLEHAYLTSDVTDETRFCLATVRGMWNAIERTWEVAPTSERIVQDIDRVLGALMRIVEAEGNAIQFQMRRTGYRSLLDLPPTPRNNTTRDPNEWLRSLHPHAKKAALSRCFTDSEYEHMEEDETTTSTTSTTTTTTTTTTQQSSIEEVKANLPVPLLVRMAADLVRDPQLGDDETYLDDNVAATAYAVAERMQELQNQEETAVPPV